MATIVRACLEHQICATASVVVSNQPEVAGLSTARQLGIEAHVVPSKGAVDRTAFERGLAQCIDSYRPDLIVLAGFMRVLTPPFVERYLGRMLNIHPSLLPKYPGLHTHQRVLEAGDPVHGATVHFVTPELDGGPLILQSQVPVRAGDTESGLQARVQATEHVIYPRVIDWLASGRLRWNDGAPVLDGRPLKDPVVEQFDAS
jgi:phosphoribosylglycinamide formyltransferase-1